MNTTLLSLTGLTIAVLGAGRLVLTFRRGEFLARGRRRIRRASHPVMFWANTAGMGVVCAIGLLLIGWALTR